MHSNGLEFHKYNILLAKRVPEKNKNIKSIKDHLESFSFPWFPVHHHMTRVKRGEINGLTLEKYI